MLTLLRGLVACNALLLALPPGWCCLPAARAESAPQPASSSCCCEHAPPAPEQPASPHPGKPCPRQCCHRDATPPAAVDKLHLDSTPAALPAVVALGCDQPGSGPDGVPVVHLLARPLQLLHCVWLC
ncbi:MAG TPA: hypothetical protein VFA26_14710 [Gemmataceae bacterium]|nr:hypothetical protein [Gemmataceae bacterium]